MPAIDSNYVQRFKSAPESRQKQVYSLLNANERQRLDSALQGGDGGVWDKAMGKAMDTPVIGSAMESVGKAGAWWHRNVSEPLAASAWSIGVQLQPGMQQGEEKLKDAGTWDWGSRVEGYREWDSPWGVKFAMEVGLDPTTYITGAGLFGAGAKLTTKGALAAKVGAPLMKAGQALSKVENAIVSPITKPAGYIAKKTNAKVGATKIYREVIEGTDKELMIAVPATGREIAKDLLSRSRSRIIGVFGRNVPDELQPVNLAYHTSLQIQDMARTQPEIFTSQLKSRANELFGEDKFAKIFNTDADSVISVSGIIPKSPKESMVWGDVFANPRNYKWGGMEFDEAIKAGNKYALYRNTYTQMQGMMAKLLTDNGIEIKLLGLADGEDYIGRVVLGKTSPKFKTKGIKGKITGKKEVVDEFYDYNVLKSKTLGTKTTGERERAFRTMRDGVEDGYKYADPEDTLNIRLSQTYNRLAQQEALKVLLPFSKTMRERFPKQVRDEYAQLRKSVTKAERELKAAKIAANEPGKRIGKELFDELPEDMRMTISRIQEGAPTNVGDMPTMKMLSKGEIQRMLDKARVKVDRAKVEFNKFKGTTYKEATHAAKGGGTTGKVRLPALQGRIIEDVYDGFGNPVIRGVDLADAIEAKFTPEAISKTLDTISKSTRFMVTAQAAMDFSWAMIQGWGALAHDMAMLARGKPSGAWAKGLKGTVDGFNSVENVTKNLANNTEFLMRHRHLMTDAPDLYGAISAVEHAWNKVPVIGKWVAKGYEKTGRAFTHAGVLARIDIAKGLEHTYAKELGVAIRDLPEDIIMQIDEMANKLTGTISTEALGVSAKQRMVESATLFAPRFLRANLMLMRDFTRGGMTGKLARERLSMLMGGMIGSYAGICGALGQNPHLDPRPTSMGGDGGKFLSFDVLGMHVGYPGFWNSMLRLGAGIAGAVDEDPEALIKLDIRDNPTLNWLAAKSSPMVGAAREIIEGRDFLGNRIDDPEDWAKIAAQKVMPIMLQNFMQVNQDGDAKLLFGEVFGMRVWGTSEWDKRNELRNKYADSTYNKEWGELNQGEKGDLERDYTDLKEMTDKINQDWAMQTGSDFERAYYLVTSQVDKEFSTQMESLGSRLQNGVIGWSTYNERRSKIIASKSSSKDTAYSMKKILDKESVESIEKWVNENQTPEDAAMSEYKEIFANPVIDLYGGVDWDATYQNVEKFLNRQASSVKQYIKQYENDWILDLPDIARVAEQQRLKLIDTLRPYWEIKSKILSAYPITTQRAIEQFRQGYQKYGRDWAGNYLQLHPSLANAINEINNRVGEARDGLRTSNFKVDQAVELWSRRPSI